MLLRALYSVFCTVSIRFFCCCYASAVLYIHVQQICSSCKIVFPKATMKQQKRLRKTSIFNGKNTVAPEMIARQKGVAEFVHKQRQAQQTVKSVTFGQKCQKSVPSSHETKHFLDKAASGQIQNLQNFQNSYSSRRL